MTIQLIEQAVRKQLPAKKEQSLLSRGFICKDTLHDEAMILICGIAATHLPNATKAVTKHYDITEKGFHNNVRIFNNHMKRVLEIITSYGVDVSNKDYYRDFSEKFWKTHNSESCGDINKSGIILSHILSSKREFRDFLQEESCLKVDDYVSFFIFNKARLALNYLKWTLPKKKAYVDILDMAF